LHVRNPQACGGCHHYGDTYSNCRKSYKGEAMKKWEYTFFNPQDFVRPVETTIEQMNKLGAEGWRKADPFPTYPHIIVMEREIPESPDILTESPAILDLSIRGRKAMFRLGIRTIGDLIKKTAHDLYEQKNLGWTSIREIQQKLHDYGLKLKGD